MKRRRFFSVLLGLVCVLLVAQGALAAMGSDHFRLDWFVPLTGSGAPASSAHFGVNLTVGQTGVASSASEHFRSCLGYWCIPAEFDMFLPMVKKY